MWEETGGWDGSQPYLDAFQGPFTAKVTAIAAGSGTFAGLWCYTWTEQDGSGAYAASANPRAGTATVCPLLERNNRKASTVPFFALVRFRGTMGTMPVYEFDADALPDQSVLASVTPTQLGANTNNYDLTSTWASVLRLSTDASRDLTGLVPPTVASGTELYVTIENVGSFNLVLKHQSGSSTAANRFILPGAADMTLAPNDAATLLYDPSTARWRTVAGGVSTSPAFTGVPTFAGSSSGATGLQASAAASGTLTLPAATDTLIGKATTDTLTNKTFDTAGAGNVLKINGTAISDKTGTGKVVLDTSPTLVTPNLGVPSAIDLTNATNVPAPSGGVTWVKVTKSYTDFSTAGTSNTITIYTLAAKQVIQSIVMRHSAAFAGGAIATYVMGVAIGSDTWISSLTNVHGSAPTGATAIGSAPAGAGGIGSTIAGAPVLYSFAGTQNVSATATSGGANLNAATAGSVDFWLEVATLP